MNIEDLSPSEISSLIRDSIARGNEILKSHNLVNHQCTFDDVVGATSEAFEEQRRALIYVDAVDNFLGGRYLEDAGEEDTVISDGVGVPTLETMIAALAVAHKIRDILPEEIGRDAISDAVKYSLGFMHRHNGPVDYPRLDFTNTAVVESAARSEISEWWGTQVVLEEAIDSGTDDPWEWVQSQPRKGLRP